MNKYQFSALFFLLLSFRAGLDSFTYNAVSICYAIAFLIGIWKGE